MARSFEKTPDAKKTNKVPDIPFTHILAFQGGYEMWMSEKLNELRVTPEDQFPENYSMYLSRLEAYCAHSTQKLRNMREHKQIGEEQFQVLTDAINDIHADLITAPDDAFAKEFDAILADKRAAA